MEVFVENFILGLDLGTNSIGWAIIGCDENANPSRLIDANSRIFLSMMEADAKPRRTNSAVTSDSHAGKSDDIKNVGTNYLRYSLTNTFSLENFTSHQTGRVFSTKRANFPMAN